MVETSPKQPPLVIAHFTVTGGNEAGVDLASHASIFRELVFRPSPQMPAQPKTTFSSQA